MDAGDLQYSRRVVGDGSFPPLWYVRSSMALAETTKVWKENDGAQSSVWLGHDGSLPCSH
jgi:hypothetical protein